MRLTRRAAIAAVLAAAPPVARAAGFPARMVRVVVPYAPGGGTDIVTRIVAQHATLESGQSFVVENRGGGASIPGTHAVLTAAPDGYTIGVTDLALLTNPGLYGARLPYDTERDVTAIGAVAVTLSALLAHPRTGARTLEDFLAQARARPGALACAHAGNGSPGHLSAVLLQMATGLRFALVGYRGAGPAAAALAAGEAPFGFSAIPTVKGHVEAGLLRALAVAGATRNPALPEVPSFAELGWPQVDAPSIYGVFAPAHLPEAIVQRLNSLMVRPAADAAVRARLEPLGYGVIAGSAEDYATLIHTAIPRWREVIAATGMQPE